VAAFHRRPVMSAQRQPIIPELLRLSVPGYRQGRWDYPLRCADVESALTAARERVEEWDQEADAHGWWHERPHWIALHNEVLRLRTLTAAPGSGPTATT
jgi:hypothetical protein